MLPPALVAVSPGDLGANGAVDRRRALAFLGALEKARRAGLRAVLVREPLVLDRALLDLARDVRSAIGDGWLGLHDRVHLVSAARADAVHLGHRSLAPAVARTLVDASVAIGFSAHEGDDVAHWSTSDYVFFGPVLDTPSKRGKKPPVGFDGVERAVQAAAAPVWAIGGLKPEHAALARESGAQGIAVISGLFAASDPEAVCAEYLRAWE
jgi:thiamine-phosphate pyrophosphorylase